MRRVVPTATAAIRQQRPTMVLTAPIGHHTLQSRHFTFSRVIAQTWLIILTYVPASKAAATTAAATSATSSSTAAAATAAAAGGGLASSLYLGLADPTLIMLGCGVLARLSTLPISLFGDRCLCRLASAMPELITAYQSYTAIADHPKSIGWERKVARSKLKRDRQRIFGLHGTGSLRTFVPQLIATAMAGYYALIPAGIASTAAVVSQPLIPIAAPLYAGAAGGVSTGLASAVAGGGVTAAVAMLDGSFAVAAALTIFNARGVVQRRKGFNSTLDERLDLAQRAGTMGLAAAVGAGCYLAPLVLTAAAGVVGTAGAVVAPVALVPSYLGPFWLGVSLTSTMQRAIHGAAPLRSAFDLAAYPPTHGTYGNASTGSIVDRTGDDASAQIDEYERTEQWKKHKMLLDFECNMKIFKLMKFLRLENAEDDFERRRERMAFRIAAAKSKNAAEAGEGGELGVDDENDEQLISQSLPKGPKSPR